MTDGASRRQIERYQMKRVAAGVEWPTRAKSSWAEAEMVGMDGGESRVSRMGRRLLMRDLLVTALESTGT